MEEIHHEKGVGRVSNPETEQPGPVGKPAEETSGPVAEFGMHSTWVGGAEWADPSGCCNSEGNAGGRREPSQSQLD